MLRILREELYEEFEIGVPVLWIISRQQETSLRLSKTVGVWKKQTVHIQDEKDKIHDN